MFEERRGAAVAARQPEGGTARAKVRSGRVLALLVMAAVAGLVLGWAPAGALSGPPDEIPSPGHTDFGWAIDIDGDRMIVGASVGGTVNIYIRDAAGAWVLDATFSGGTFGYGFAVAIEGDTAVIGSLFGGPDSDGQVFVMRRTAPATWSQIAILNNPLPRDPLSGNGSFGSSVDVSNGVIVVGDPRSQAVAENAGAVYTYVDNGLGGYNSEQLVASDAQEGDLFGERIALDGSILVVGADGRSDDPANPNSRGRAYVYQVDPDGDVSNEQVLAATPDAYDRLGYDVAVSGNTIVVGAPHVNALNPTGGDPYVLVYQRNLTTGLFDLVDTLTPSDAPTPNWFGIRVDILDDRIAIGAQSDSAIAPFAGAAYVFERNPNNTFTEVQKLTAPTPAVQDRYGEVALGDGFLAVGAHQDDDVGLNRGKVYVYYDDSDGDGVADGADNCPAVANPTQADFDGDGLGDACDPDDDNDTVGDVVDAFPFDPTEWVDGDGDGVGDNGDNCPALSNLDQADFDGDGMGDACDEDDDNDGQSDFAEFNCFSNPLDPLSLAPDFDGDNLPDCIDPDDDNDGIPDNIDSFPFDPTRGQDADGDGFDDAEDNCPFQFNADQADNDGDGVGDVCDADDDNDGQSDADEVACGSDPLSAASLSADADADGSPDCVDPDVDGDGVPNGSDNCPAIANADQADLDADGIGDVCDPTNDADADGDGVIDSADNCPSIANAGQENVDGDSFGDACDPDDDNDGVADGDDAFPLDPSESVDTDGDGVGNNADTDDDNDGQLDADEVACGSDPLSAASLSADADGDGSPDCVDPDVDGDGVANDSDNCPAMANTDQADTDADGIGDVCDPVDDRDSDGDGVLDAADVCPGTVLPDEPTRYQKRWRYVANTDGEFVNRRGHVTATIDQTGGCSGTQIIDELDLRAGHRRYGISWWALWYWIYLQNGESVHW